MVETFGKRKHKCGCETELIDYGGITMNMIHKECAKHKEQSTKRAIEALKRQKAEREARKKTKS